MDAIVRARMRYALLLESVIAGTLVLTPSGEIAGPDGVAHGHHQLSALPTEERLRVLAVLAAYYVERLPEWCSGADVMRGLATLVGKELSTTQFCVRPVVRTCIARCDALSAHGKADWTTNRFRIIAPNGDLVIPVKDWQPDDAAIDLACMYQLQCYGLTDVDDQYAVTAFVHRHRDRLSPGVLYEYVQRVLFEYIENGTGIVARVLPPDALRALGQSIFLRGGFAHHLSCSLEQQEVRLARLTACGFVIPVSS